MALPFQLYHASLYFLCMQLSLTDILQLQHPGVFNATQASVSQCHNSLLGPPWSTCLPHTWPQWRKTPQPLYSYILPDTKARGMWTALLRSPAPWITAQAAFSHCYYLEEENSVSLFFLQVGSLGKVLLWGCPHVSQWKSGLFSISLFFYPWLWHYISWYSFSLPTVHFVFFSHCLLLVIVDLCKSDR